MIKSVHKKKNILATQAILKKFLQSKIMQKSCSVQNITNIIAVGDE